MIMKNLKNILSDYTETATPPHPQSLQKIKRNKNNILYNSFSSLISIRNERGRTLTETVGVLAVMGILTIGAVTGYRYGINKYRSNQILQDIRLIYQEIKYPLTVQKIVETGTLPHIEADTQSAYEYNFTFPDLDNFSYNSTGEAAPHLLSVNVSGVPANVCDILLKNKPPYVLMLQVNTENVHSCEESENELNYIFEITSDSFEYGTCSVCSDNHCFDDDLNCPEGETCQNDICAPCDKDYTQKTDGDCYPCNNVHSLSYWHKDLVSKEVCLRCDNTTWISYWGRCHNCDVIHTWQAKKKECDLCSQINSDVVFLGINENDGGCSNCNHLGSVPNTLESQCKKCPGTVWYPKTETSTAGLCTTCDCNAKPAADGKTCECIDTNRYWAFVDGVPQWGVCDLCTTSTTRWAPKRECDKCNERYFSGTNDRFGQCILCPTGKVKSSDGRSCVDAPTE
ncbi:MAG: Tfp pilus assembly protein FimT/FimU [Alphaproteobacteria bacterium]